MSSVSVDHYIDKSPDFAQSILNHLRELVHKACPEVEEAIKWSFPNFVYKGAILCHMAAFKQHCTFGFWLGAQMEDKHGLLTTGSDKTAMGHLGKISSLKDLPSDKIMLAYLKEAMKLTESGAKLKKAPAKGPKTLTVPDYLIAALKRNKKALATFESFSYSNQKEYVEWITEAKTEATREKRLDTAIEWMGEGKTRHWKYNTKS